MSELIDYNEPLYRYRSLNVFSIKELINGEFFFAPPNMLNDPFEANFKINYKEPSINDFHNSVENTFLNYVNTTKTSFEKTHFFKTRKKIELVKTLNSFTGTVCFSKTNKEVLMWSHYSDSHKGFCLEFDNGLINTINTAKFYIVNYSNKLQILDWSLDDTESDIKTAIKTLTTKTKNWEYEAEIRALLIKGGSDVNTRTFDKKFLKSIILGCNISSDDIKLLENIIRMDKDYSHVTFKVAYKSELTNELIIEGYKDK